MKPNRMILCMAAVALTALCVAAAPAEDHPLADSQAGMARALKEGDAVALTSFYTEDARLSFPLRPDVIGRDEILRNSEFVVGLGVRSFHIVEEELFAGEEFTLQSGTCIFYNETGQEFDRTRFMTVWRKVDGRWLIHRDFVV